MNLFDTAAYAAEAGAAPGPGYMDLLLARRFRRHLLLPVVASAEQAPQGTEALISGSGQGR